MPESRDTRTLGALIQALGFGLCILFLAFTPPWQIPDEPQHFQLASLVADLGRWPDLADVSAATGLQDDTYASLVAYKFWAIRGHRQPPPSLTEDTAPDLLLPPVYAPPVYYGLAAGALRLFPNLTLDAQLFALRLVGALIGVIELFLIYRMSRLALADRPSLARATVTVAALLPMRAYITGGASPGALASALGAASLLLMVAFVDRPLTPARGAALGLVLALALLTKRTTAFLVPTALAFLVLDRRHARQRTALWWSSAAVSAACLALPLLAWSLLRPPIAPAGVPWPYPSYTPEGLLGVRSEWLARFLSADAWTLSAIGDYARWLGITFASFWADFGWLTEPLDVGWYVALAVLTALSLVGWALRLRRGRGVGGPRVAVLAWAAGFAVLQLLGTMLGQGVPQQGRYLFPALGAIGVLLVLGWAELWPARAQRALPLAVGAALLVLAAVSFAGVMLPTFYGAG